MTFEEDCSTPTLSEGACGLSINGKVFSLEDVCRALGADPGAAPVVSLCIGVKAGVLKSSLCNEDPSYPGIRTELALPPEAESADIMLTVTEQPRSDDKHEPVRTFGYNRDDEYFLYFDADTRPDREVEDDLRRPSVTIGGNPQAPKMSIRKTILFAIICLRHRRKRRKSQRLMRLFRTPRRGEATRALCRLKVRPAEKGRYIL